MNPYLRDIIIVSIPYLISLIIFFSYKRYNIRKSREYGIHYDIMPRTTILVYSSFIAITILYAIFMAVWISFIVEGVKY